MNRLSDVTRQGDVGSSSPVGELLAARNQGLSSPTSSFVQRKVFRPALGSRRVGSTAGSAPDEVSARTSNDLGSRAFRRESYGESSGRAIGFVGSPNSPTESSLPVFEMADLGILNTFTHCVWVTTMKRGCAQYVFANDATLGVWGCTKKEMLEMDLESHESESTQQKRDMLYELVQVAPTWIPDCFCACRHTHCHCVVSQVGGCLKAPLHPSAPMLTCVPIGRREQIRPCSSNGVSFRVVCHF